MNTATRAGKLRSLEQLTAELLEDPVLLRKLDDADRESAHVTKHDRRHGEIARGVGRCVMKHCRRHSSGKSKFPRAAQLSAELALKYHDIGRSAGKDQLHDHAAVGADFMFRYLLAKSFPKDLAWRVSEAIRNHGTEAVLTGQLEDPIALVVAGADKVIGNRHRVREDAVPKIIALAQQWLGLGDPENCAARQAEAWSRMDRDPRHNLANLAVGKSWLMPDGSLLIHQIEIDTDLVTPEQFLEVFGRRHQAAALAFARLGNFHLRIEFNGGEHWRFHERLQQWLPMSRCEIPTD